MVNSPALVSGVCGKGRVILCSPHPEQTAGLEPLIISQSAGWPTVSRGSKLHTD